MRICMSHELVRLLGRAVQVEWVIDIVRGAERHARIGAVDRGRRGVEKMSAPGMAASFEDVEKANEVGISISVRVGQRMAHPGLRCEVNDVGKTLRRKEAPRRLA